MEGCHRLKLQLLKHQIPVKRFPLLWQPWEILGQELWLAHTIQTPMGDP